MAAVDVLRGRLVHLHAVDHLAGAVFAPLADTNEDEHEEHHAGEGSDTSRGGHECVDMSEQRGNEPSESAFVKQTQHAVCLGFHGVAARLAVPD